MSIDVSGMLLDDVVDDAGPKRQPFPHQRRAIEQLKLWGGRGLLCDEMGLGKSATALWTLDELKATPIVVVCPLSIVHKWAQEVRDALGEEAVVLSGRKGKKKGAPLEGLTCSDATAGPLPRVRILHWDMLLRLNDRDLAALVGGLLPGTAGLILDEVHLGKNRLAQRSRCASWLAFGCRYVLGLTGTLIRCDVRDVWHPAQLVRPGHLGTYAHFEAHYTRQFLLKLPNLRRPVRKFEGSKNEAELQTRLHDIMILRKKKDVFDLPEKVRVVVPIDMGKAERERYDEMKRSAMVMLKDIAENTVGGFVDGKLTDVQTVIARTALEQVIRLEQLTCGVLGGTDGAPLLFEDAAKIQWTLETIEELRAEGRSVAVFCKFNATIDILCDERNGPAWTLTGQTPSNERAARIAEFRESHGGILLCQLKLAEGFDLTPCTDAIFLGIDWTPAMMDQAEDRLHRIGTTGTVNCYYPIARSSIDIRLHRTVIERREDARRVLSVKDVEEELKA